MHEWFKCIRKEGWLHTFARSYFKDKNSSRFLKDLSSCMSLGKQRVFSKHSATKPKLPFLWSLKLASLNTGLPKLSVKIGLQTEGLGGWSPFASLEVLMEALLFCRPLLVRASGNFLGPLSLDQVGKRLLQLLVHLRVSFFSC